MGFYKVASVQSLGTATFVEGGLHRVASEGSAAAKSYYVDGARKIDIGGMLDKVAERYIISKDPSDYFFEAIRANTVNVPNENHDGFHKSELLRFDTRYASPLGDKVGMPVYMTYVGKPHHLNHKADDPKRARGVILDAHYNDSAPALENCPKCLYRTAEESHRDPSGIHCAKCGSVVKDEFVEILVAVDTKKDPALARGIQAGILNAGSMGCNCASTVCNVCDHVARSVSDFCEHIRGASKGSLWKVSGKGSKPTRITADEVKRILRRAKYEDAGESKNLVAVSLVIPEEDFEVRKAFEYCQGVEFDEYSRVHRPADPKALTVEILKAAGADSQLSIEQETEQLLIRAQLERLEAPIMTRSDMTKAASQTQTFYAVRVNGNDEDIHVAADLAFAVKKAQLGRRDHAEYFTIEAAPENALARAIKASLTKSAQYLPLGADVQLVIPDGVQVHVNDPGMGGQPGQPGMPGDPNAPGSDAVVPPGPSSIEDVTQQQMQPADPQQSPEEFGMLPPGASAPSMNQPLQPHAEGGPLQPHAEGEGMATGDTSPQYGDVPIAAEGEGGSDTAGDSGGEADMEHKYAAVYGDFEVEVFADRAILRAPGGDVFTARSAKTLDSDQAKRQFGSRIIDSVLADGLVRTAHKFDATFSSRIADSTEGAMFAMKEKPSLSGGGALSGAEFAQKDKPKSVTDAPKSGASLDGYDDDMEDGERPVPANSIESRDTNLADEAEKASPSQMATDGAEFAQKDKPKSYSMSDSALEGADTDMKTKSAAKKEAERALERARRLHTAQLEKLKSDHEAEKAALEKTMVDRFARALRLAAKRAALNIEASPLKAKMVDSLTVPRPIGVSASTGRQMEYRGIDDALALHLVEAAWSDSAAAEIESLVTRAAEVMAYDDKYLVSAEQDISKHAAVIPSMRDESQLDPQDEITRRAASLREAALNGNLTLAPGTADTDAGLDKVSRIREALSPTKVGRILNGEFRPN